MRKLINTSLLLAAFICLHIVNIASLPTAYGQCCCCCCCDGCCCDCCCDFGECDGFGGTEGFAMPTDTAMWVNSRPITLSMLRGKGAMLYFYDAESIEVAPKWIDLRLIADEYADWPIMFIGVSPGNSRSDVRSFVFKNQIQWPVIADEERQFARRAGVGEIGSRRYEQVVIIDVDGESIVIDEGVDIREAIERALEGASWLVDPNLITPSLEKAWRAVEFPNYAVAEREIRQALKSSDEEELRAARLLNNAIWNQMEKEAAVGRELAKNGEYFTALQALNETRTRFSPYPMPQQLIDQINWLKARPEVQDEYAARDQLKKAKGLIRTEKSSLINRARAQLRSIATRYPKTLAAQEAIDLFNSTETSFGSSRASGGSSGCDGGGCCCCF